MQRILILKPPYGTAFMFAPNQGGGPHNIWLMYDSAADATVLQWMRDTLTAHEEYLRVISQSVPPPPPPPLAEVTVVPPAQAVLNRISTMTVQGGHDWGSAYKFGLLCKRCGQTANGLESRCAQPITQAWTPTIGKRVIDKRNGTSYVVEGGDNGRWLMLDGPVLLTEQIEPDPSDLE